MRFCVGLPPTITPDFQPDGRLDCESPKQFSVSFLFVFLVIVPALFYNYSIKHDVSVVLAQMSAAGAADLIKLFGFFILVTLVHETIHFLSLMGFGMQHTVVGFHPKMFAPYVGYGGTWSRTRALSFFLMPFVALTVLPTLACLTLELPESWASVLLGVSVFNAISSAGDIAVVHAIFRTIPSDALLQGAYWRHAKG